MASLACASTATIRWRSTPLSAGRRTARASNNGPTLIEHFTYRAEGHSTSDDPSQYRSAHEREEWPLGDPIMRLKRHLIALGEWSIEQQEAMDKELAETVKAATKEAEKNGILGHGMHHPFHTMFEDVFEELPWHLEEQAEQAIRERADQMATVSEDDDVDEPGRCAGPLDEHDRGDQRCARHHARTRSRL